MFAPEFVNVITDTVNYAGADPHRLTLEITENAFLHDLEDAAAKIRTLDDLGIHFALDDFGSGYSSLSSLKKLLLRELKIDQNFVHDMSLDSRDRTIEGIIMLAHHLHLNVVAEGVETETQRRALVTMGCDALQGYLISKPLSKSSFFEWLH